MNLNAMNLFEETLILIKPIRQFKVQGITVSVLPKAVMNSFFGYNLYQKIYIVEGLSSRVQSFVINHEIYHIDDNSSSFGWIRREFRVNADCGLKDPVDLIAIVAASMNRKRQENYWGLLKRLGRF